VNRLQPLGVDVQHSPGCNINKKLPELDVRNLRDVRMDYFNDVEQMDNPSAVPDMAGTTGVFRLLWTGDPLGRREPNISFGARMSTVFTPHVSGEWSFSLESVAAARINCNSFTISFTLFIRLSIAPLLAAPATSAQSWATFRSWCQ
jgi:hypothetical protein